MRKIGCLLLMENRECINRINEKYHYIEIVLKSCKNQEQVENVMSWEEGIRHLFYKEYGVTAFVTTLLESKKRELNNIKDMIIGRTGSYFESPYNDEIDEKEYDEEYTVALILKGKCVLVESDNKLNVIKDILKDTIEKLKEQGIVLEDIDLVE